MGVQQDFNLAPKLGVVVAGHVEKRVPVAGTMLPDGKTREVTQLDQFRSLPVVLGECFVVVARDKEVIGAHGCGGLDILKIDAVPAARMLLPPLAPSDFHQDSSHRLGRQPAQLVIDQRQELLADRVLTTRLQRPSMRACLAGGERRVRPGPAGRCL
jgi:hypothetical protein